MIMDPRGLATIDQDTFVDPRAFGLTKAAYSVNDTLDLLSIGRTTFYSLVCRGE
jgi:hypothetical protein